VELLPKTAVNSCGRFSISNSVSRVPKTGSPSIVRLSKLLCEREDERKESDFRTMLVPQPSATCSRTSSERRGPTAEAVYAAYAGEREVYTGPSAALTHKRARMWTREKKEERRLLFVQIMAPAICRYPLIPMPPANLSGGSASASRSIRQDHKCLVSIPPCQSLSASTSELAASTLCDP